MSKLICNACGREWDKEDSEICPVCGTNSVQEKEEE